MGVEKYADQIKKWCPSFLFKAGSQAYIDWKFPRHLFIETTQKCNLSCSYCPRPRQSGNMSWELFTRIVDEASEHGHRSFSLHLFGEPLLWPHIERGCRYINKKNPKHTIILTTNGTVEPTNNVVEAVDKFIVTWKPRLSQKALHDMGSKLLVRFIKEVTPKEEIERWKGKAEVRSLHNYGGNIKGTDAKSAVKRWPCYHLWFAPGISWNGDFLICCSDPKKETVLGNIKDTTIADLWRGPAMRLHREAQKSGVFHGPCENCDVWLRSPDLFYQWQKRY